MTTVFLLFQLFQHTDQAWPLGHLAMQVFLLPGQGPYSLLDVVPLSASAPGNFTVHCCTNEVIVATMLLESLRLLFAPRLPLDLSGKARI
jgi:hypothetical protein